MKETLVPIKTKNYPGMILRFTDNPAPADYGRLSGATVTINGQTTTTDENGYFIIDNLPVGVHTLTATHPLWASFQQDVLVTESDSPENFSNSFTIVPEVNIVFLSLGTGVSPPQTSFHFEASATDSGGVPHKAAATWTVDKPDQASIDSSGIFYTEKEGTYIVTGTASDGSTVDSVTVKVVKNIATIEGIVVASPPSAVPTPHIESPMSSYQSESTVPVQGANVSLGNCTQAALTDAEGRYTIVGVPAVDDTINIFASGAPGNGSTSISNLVANQVNIAPTIVLSGTGTGGVYPGTTPTYGPTPTTGPAPTATLPPTSWSTQHNSSGVLLEDIDAVDSGNVWACGFDLNLSEGNIWNTSDGGSVWSLQHTAPNISLSGISFPNNSYGWACGTDAMNGEVLSTSDGGATWSPPQTVAMEPLNDIYFPSSDFGCTVGSNGTIYFTNNGGGSWFPAATNPAAGRDVWGVYFYNESMGWAVGDGGMILRTFNGGVDWIDVSNPLYTDTLYGVHFIMLTTDGQLEIMKESYTVTAVVLPGVLKLLILPAILKMFISLLFTMAGLLVAEELFL